MKYLILFVFALCPLLLISGTFGAFLAVLLFALVQMYLCTTKSGKKTKIGLARLIIKIENIFTNL